MGKNQESSENYYDEDSIRIEHKDTVVYSNVEVKKFAKMMKSDNLFNFKVDSNTNSFPCILKFYEENDNKLPKLNEIIKVKGIL